MRYSVVNYSEIKNTFDFRIDAEYWHPDFIRNSQFVSKDNPKIRDFVEHNVPNIKSSPINRDFEYLEISNISVNSCEYETTKIKFGEEPDRAHHILKKSDIVVSTVRPNRNAVACIEKSGIIGSSGLSILRAKNIESEYLLAFCKTDYFTKCLIRANKASMYPAVSNNDILDVPIFVPSFQFKMLIIEIVKGFHSKNRQAKQLYTQAQNILLTELGLAGWTPEHQLTFFKDYSEVRRAERFDADYFQPKYNEIIKAIKCYSGGCSTLGHLCELVGHPSNPPYAETEDTDKTFIITQKHLGDFTLNDEFWNDEEALYTTKDFIDKFSEYVLQAEDVLLYSVGAYIGKANIYKENIKATIGSFLTLLRTRKEKLNPYYLMAFLNTDVGIAISKQHQRGMAQQYLYPYDIRTFPIPLLYEEIQTEIQEKVTESFDLRKQSKRLLECAKRAVEIAIEEDEETATEWLEKETVEIGSGRADT